MKDRIHMLLVVEREEGRWTDDQLALLRQVVTATMLSMDWTIKEFHPWIPPGHENPFEAIFGPTREHPHEDPLPPQPLSWIRRGSDDVPAWGKGNRQVERYNEQDVTQAEVVLAGTILEDFGLEPVWENPRAVKTWLRELRDLVLATGKEHDLTIIMDAVSRAVKANDKRQSDERMTYGSPRAFNRMVGNVRAERSRGASTASPLGLRSTYAERQRYYGWVTGDPHTDWRTYDTEKDREARVQRYTEGEYGELIER